MIRGRQLAIQKSLSACSRAIQPCSRLSGTGIGWLGLASRWAGVRRASAAALKVG